MGIAQIKKGIFKTLSSILLVTTLVGSLGLTPGTVFAQTGLPVSDIAVLTKLTQAEVSAEVKRTAGQAFVANTAMALINLLMASAEKMAYTSAVWVASGGPGETPLFNNESVSDVAKNAGLQVMSVAVDNITSKEVVNGVLRGYGVKVSNKHNTLAAIRDGIKGTFLGDTSADGFSFPDFSGNFQGFLVSTLGGPDSSELKTKRVLAGLSDSFTRNDFSGGLYVYTSTLAKSQSESDTRAQEAIANDGFVDKINPITGKVATPASEVKKQLDDATDQAKELPYKIGDSLPDSSTLLAMGGSLAKIFSNTLLSELSKKMFAGLFADIGSLSSNPFDSSLSNGYSRERAEKAYKSILSFTPISVTEYNLLSKLSTCPATLLRNSQELYSCGIDTSFASAVSRAESGSALTLKEAISEGYINGAWKLIPSTDVARNQDPRCYSYGFCHSNLLKLRKARIIPVGWEIAAESNANLESKPVSLEEVMNAFNDCNVDGQLDAEHPWCHLIDPNWILKAPETQCRTLAYGQLLIASGSDSRAEECVDIQTCINEGDDGQCDGGYGYCVREQNVWRFRGDECPAQYASCLSMKDRDNNNVDFLTNTVDFASCDQNSVGCLWTATQKRALGTGGFDWPIINNVAEADAKTDAYKNRIYVNKNVEKCDASQNGCSEVILRTGDNSLNLIQNSSFELDNDANNAPDAWLPVASLDYNATGLMSRSGDMAVDPGAPGLYQYGAVLNQARFYALSFYARRVSDITAGAINLRLELASEFVGEENVNVTGTSTVGCTASGNIITMIGAPDSTSYQRFECIFTAPMLANKSARIDARVFVFGNGAFIDDVQLEQNQAVSTYHEGYSTNVTTFDHIKLAPSYLGCSGTSTDPAECANYAQLCSSTEVGCESYIPNNGDPAIFATATPTDFCPNECVGYDSYKQEPTLYEPNGEFPVHFIPDTGEQCSQSAVGCSEFTRLDNEVNEYFTYLRSCVNLAQADANTNGDNMAVYYTWEGSDTEGFQLKRWDLLESNADTDAYQTIVQASGFVETKAGLAPCTQAKTNIDGIVCADDANLDGKIDSVNASCDDHNDIFRNPDCREFYDGTGEIHYRLWSKTITVSDACNAYRKTDIAGNNEIEKRANCELSGGYFDAGLNSCRYFGFNRESNSCNATQNGCREYTGGRSNNSRVALDELFEGDLTAFDARSAGTAIISNESIATDGHSLKATGMPVWTYTYNMGAVCNSPNGCSSPAGTALGASCVVSEGETSCGTLNNSLFPGKTYTLSFWAKGNGSLSVGFTNSTSGAENPGLMFTSGVTLSPDWHEYKLGPIDVNALQNPDFGKGTSLLFNPGPGVTFNLDNIVLREGEQNITVIKNSWVTPSTCDMNPTGQLSPQYQLGCSAYTSSTGNRVTARSFSRLCDEGSVGCTAYFSTAESNPVNGQVLNASCKTLDGNPAIGSTACHLKSVPGPAGIGAISYVDSSPVVCTIDVNQTSCLFNLDYALPESDVVGVPEFSHLVYGPETVVVKADTDLYAIASSGDHCTSAGAGCMEVGVPKLSADRSTVTSWKSDFIVNDPDNYSKFLCNSEKLYCEEYNAGNSGTFYFKDPGARQCEYKTNVFVGTEKFSGWFVTGTSNFCYGSGTCSDDNSACSFDSECRVNTGICSNSSNACSSDFDCGARGKCKNISTATCNITQGSLIEGGDFSGIWRNGDVAYTGWTATCPSEWNACSEFQDPLSIDANSFYPETAGKAYNFINNDRLTADDILSGTKCNGLVSQTLGCTLFNDTGEPGLDYNASATYVLSTHADSILGTEPEALVKPISCSAPDSSIRDVQGNSLDLCEQRCVYDRGAVYDITDAKLAGGVSGKLADNLQGTANYTANDLYVFAGSCYNQSDCSVMKSELGEDVKGVCAPEVFDTITLTATAPYWKPASMVPVPRLANDTNQVLKVDRDRTCGEWLNCASSTTVWDDSIGSYRNICDSLALCSEYSDTGDSSSCSKWNVKDVPEVFTEDVYAKRNTSWYGEEYSGYSIPNNFAIQHLDQVDITFKKGTCELDLYVKRSSSDKDLTSTDYLNYDNQPCANDSDCGGFVNTCNLTNPNNEFTLGFVAGSCSEDEAYIGTACVVGHCSNDGTSCGDNLDCKQGGSCVTGSCFEVEEGSQCSQDTDCNATQICSSGVCVKDLNTQCDSDLLCKDAGGLVIPNATCFQAVSTQEGTCYRGSCVLSASGDKLDANGSEVVECRAQPEQFSPFPNKIVSLWSKFDTVINRLAIVGSKAIEAGARAIPYSTKQGFEEANYCAPGETCECSYKKLQTSGGATAFVDNETTVDDIERRLIQEFPEVDAGSLGICTSGDAAGAFCIVRNDGQQFGCGSTQSTDGASMASAGNCNVINKEDDAVGLEGYCLERDTGLNINGDQTTGACLTWLPIDQLRGSTDLFAKNLEAGYFEETYMCNDTRLFVDIGPTRTGMQKGDMACAEIATEAVGGCSSDNSADRLFGTNGKASCATNVICPTGYFALVGQCAFNSNQVTNHYASACLKSAGDDDCPYVCVPDASYHTKADSTDFKKQCVPPAESSVEFFGNATEPKIKKILSLNDTVAYAVGILNDNATFDSYEVFDTAVDSYLDCLESGLEYTDTLINELHKHACSSNAPGEPCDGAVNTDQGFRSLYVNYTVYPACKQLVEVASVDKSYAFTDRIKNPDSGFAIVDANPAMRYSIGVTPKPFGASSVNPRDVSAPQPPLKVTSCFTKGTGIPSRVGHQTWFQGIYNLPTGDEFLSCLEDQVLSPAVAEVRSYLFFDTSAETTNSVQQQDRLYPHFWTSPAIEDPANAFVERFAQLYAKIDFGKKYVWNSVTKMYDENGTVGLLGTTGNVLSSDVLVSGNPPKVYSVDTFNCYNGLCAEGSENAITVNGQDSGDQTGAKAFYRATVKFFAGADKNQLPLRRVIVNWGDDPDGNYSGSEANNNFFKNHRGLVPDSKTTSLCDTEDEWGMTSESCDPNFFTYQHNYYCDDVLLKQLDECTYDSGTGQPTNTPCADPQFGGRCAFRPAVHILDNWGWCSGVCTGGPDGSEGCFDNGWDALNNPKDEKKAAECAYLEKKNIQNYPWVYYGGTIYIEP